MTKEEYWFWLCNIKDIYQNTIRNLLDVFQEPEEIYKADEEALAKSGAVLPRQAHEIVLSKNNFRCMYKLEKLRMENIRFIHYGSAEYPASLLALPDKPYSLYVKGNLPDPDLPTAGIVGARKCSGYGREMAMRYAQSLAANQIQIISGMAVGIDTCASRGAMEAGGKTFVILGSGLDVIYPQENMELYYQIVLNGGGVISEYPMGTAPVGWQFPHRNRLISAFSDKLLVIEARKRSGTLTTAAYALSQGKDVYALPGKVTDPLSEGCNRMIADGAGVLLDPGELLQEYFGFETSLQAYPGKMASPDAPPENTLKGNVLRALDYEPRMVEEIAVRSGVDAAQTARILTELELSGLCRQVAKDYYAVGS